MSNFTNMEDFIAASIRLMEKTGKPVITASQVDEFIGESAGNVKVVIDSDNSRIFHWDKETGDWDELMRGKRYET